MAKEKLKEIFSIADIKINGNRAWDIQVHDERFYNRVLSQGSLGFGESYMDGWWDCKKLDVMFDKIFSTDLERYIKKNPRILLGIFFAVMKSKIFNMQSKLRSKKVAKKHYDLSPALYESFLDPYNQYTCGYFKDTPDLNKAQEQKLDLICKKLKLSSKDKVLDIGCGWGGFAKFAAEKYGCHVTGISISEKQVKYAKKFCQGLPVTIIKSDYRDLKGTFDKILVCGMIEHVGHKNYQPLMKIVHRRLKPDGLFLLHTLGRNISKTTCDPWMLKYIFPNSMPPSIKQLTEAMEGLFVVEDLHNFGQYYDPTTIEWFRRFDKNWDSIKHNYDERFYRMWKYYLLAGAAAFRTRTTNLWQFVLSKQGIRDGYESIR